MEVSSFGWSTRVLGRAQGKRYHQQNKIHKVWKSQAKRLLCISQNMFLSCVFAIGWLVPTPKVNVLGRWHYTQFSLSIVSPKLILLVNTSSRLQVTGYSIVFQKFYSQFILVRHLNIKEYSKYLCIIFLFISDPQLYIGYIYIYIYIYTAGA